MADKVYSEMPNDIRYKIQLLSQQNKQEPPQGLIGVVISIFDLNYTDEQRYYIWWWLFDGTNKPKEMHTKDLTPAQKQALIDWVKPERFEMPEKVMWLPQPHLYKELSEIWYEVWKCLIDYGMLIDEKIYLEA